jgi:hypothetical protein
MNINHGVAVSSSRDSKGRNGWFKPVRAVVRKIGTEVNVEIWSKRTDGQPPIDLWLSVESAKALAEELLREVEGAER